VLAGVDPAAKSGTNENALSLESEIPGLFPHRRGSAPEYPATLHPSAPSVETLSFSINGRSTLKDHNYETVFSQLKIKPFDEKTLLGILRKYSKGTLWSFGDDEANLDWGGVHRRGSNGESFRMTARERQNEPEAKLILSHFPCIRHLLYTPLFDASLGGASVGCFAFTYERSRTFSTENELSFMRNFMNNMGAELARIDAIALSSSKTDFIGSVSHELRSPLHGILAAAEFLEETPLSNYQKQLISTQISCGRTLLHVIEHVLDYSKINSFSKNEQSASIGARPKSSKPMTFGAEMQNLYERTDIAELVEEVVEGSVAGRTHATSDASLQLFRLDSTSKEPVFGFVKNVAVILTLEHQLDWVYVTTPGAVRRILMNILGNSLKYTATGCIRVRLRTIAGPQDPSSTESRSTIELTVSDTGKGISRDFLRKRLFTAFQQEDHLSTGCGLGLSIVKSLVDGLGGQLEIKSEQNVCLMLIYCRLQASDFSD
jgi:signal transduction histidine kinase